MPWLSAEDRRSFGLLLTPSWLSGLVAVVVGLVLSVGVIIAFEAHNIGLSQQLQTWQQAKPQPTLTKPGQITADGNKVTPLNSWPLLLLWSMVGLLVYGIAATIIHSLAKAETLRESLDYVNARPQTMLAVTAEHLLLRTIATVMLVGFGVMVWKRIIPYCITASHASSSAVMSLDGLLYALLSFALAALSVHILIILLRLALGRVRVFS